MNARVPFLLLALLAPACRHDASTLRIAGTIEIREVRLAPLAAGRLARLVKDEGDTVRAGDTIAVLEQPGLDALIGQRQAQVRASAARAAELDVARADSVRTASDLDRARRLLASGGVSQQAFDAAVTAATAAAARLRAARAAQNETAAASAALAATRAIRDQLTLIAPQDGIVLVRYAEPGEALAAGVPVVSIGLVHRPWVRAFVPQSAIARVRVGLPVRVRVAAYPDTTFPGTVTEIAPQAEFTPRAALTERERADLVFAIKVGIDAAGGRLKAGMPVDVEIPLLP